MTEIKENVKMTLSKNHLENEPILQNYKLIKALRQYSVKESSLYCQRRVDV